MDGHLLVKWYRIQKNNLRSLLWEYYSIFFVVIYVYIYNLKKTSSNICQVVTHDNIYFLQGIEPDQLDETSYPNH